MDNSKNKKNEIILAEGFINQNKENMLHLNPFSKSDSKETISFKKIMYKNFITPNSTTKAPNIS
ncbi:hypothetical protein PSOL_07300 [Candidatus Phytoplasma solani]